MELDNGALPLTRGQLEIWLAQETGHSGTATWQLGLFAIEGTVERDASAGDPSGGAEANQSGPPSSRRMARFSKGRSITRMSSLPSMT